jgi:hypothetical protein
LERFVDDMRDIKGRIAAAHAVASEQTPKKSYTHNTFGELIHVETVVDETNNVSGRVLTWHDGLGNVMATVDSNGKAILKLHDSFGREIETVRYAKFILASSMPTNDTTFDQLRAILASLEDPAQRNVRRASAPFDLSLNKRRRGNEMDSPNFITAS